MNNQEIATDVWKHPLIQEILKRKLAESSVVNRLIVEEIMMEDELGEAAATPKGNIAAKVRNYITRALAANKTPEEIIKLISPESNQYSQWKAAAIKALGEENGPKVVDDAVQNQIQKLKSPEQSADTGASDAPTDEAGIRKTLEGWLDKNPKINRDNFDYLLLGATLIASVFGSGWLGILSAIDAANEIEKLVGFLQKGEYGNALELVIVEATAVGVSFIPGGKALQKFLGTPLGKKMGAKGVSSFIKVAVSGGYKAGQEVWNWWKKENPEAGTTLATTGETGLQATEEDDLEWENLRKEIEPLLGQPEYQPFWAAVDTVEIPEESSIDTQKLKILVASFLKGAIGSVKQNEHQLEEKYDNLPNSSDNNISEKDLVNAISPISAHREKLKIDDPGWEIFANFLNSDEFESAWTEFWQTADASQGQLMTPTETSHPEQIETEVDEAIKIGKKDFVDAQGPEQIAIDTSVLNNMDKFFGQTEGEFSFINRAFLIDQSTMLWGLVKDLNKIIHPGGSEKRAIRVDEGVWDDMKQAGGAAVSKIQDKMAGDEESEEESHPWSQSQKVSLKRDLSAFGDLLLEVKRLAKAYRDYATQSSIDPRFDGSALKLTLSGPGEDDYGLLGQVQIHCARLVSMLAEIKKEHKEQITEADDDDKARIAQEVTDTYNEMGSMYINSIKPSLMGGLDESEETPVTPKLSKETNTKAQETAQNMLHMITTDPNIAQYFPKGIINSSGEVVTIGEAIESLEGAVKAFAKVLRDMYRTTKDDLIAGGHISTMGAALVSIAKVIQSNFNVPTLVKPAVIKKLEKGAPLDTLSIGEDEPESTDAFPDVKEIARRYIESDPTESEKSMIDKIMKKVKETVPSENLPETDDELEDVIKVEVEEEEEASGTEREPKKDKDSKRTPVRPPRKSDVIDSPHEEVELEKISDSPHYEELNKSDRKAIDEFIKQYHNFRKPSQFESQKRTELSGMTPKGYEKNLKKNLKQLQADLDLGPRALATILKQMGKKSAKKFRWMVVSKEDLIADLVTVIMKNEPDSGPSMRSQRRQNYKPGRTTTGLGTFEEQINNKLKPIIEKILKET